jgi:hypothetical protein
MRCSCRSARRLEARVSRALASLISDSQLIAVFPDVDAWERHEVTAIEGIGVVLAAIGTLGANVSLNALIRYEHDAHPGSWKADGQPMGPFWWPRGASGLSMYQVGNRWIWTTPDWASRDQQATFLLTCHRWTVSAMFAGIAILALIKVSQGAG